MDVSYTYCSDEEILSLICENDDAQAFTALYDRYFKRLFNYTYSKVNDRFTAQEIVQELFVSVWQQRKSTNIQTCRAYLFAVAKNLIISHYRKEFTRSRHYAQWEIQRDEPVYAADHGALADDLQNRYQEGLHLLPPKCREVFLLSRHGHSNRVIAIELGISEKTVEQHITKALRVLKSYLKEHFAYILLLLQVF